jgi:uncharacterized ferritin-like protein (DUF455 family)
MQLRLICRNLAPILVLSVVSSKLPEKSILTDDVVHAGLWESATETAHSLMARIAIIHLVAEARGIDMNPMTMAKLQSAGDKESTRVLTIIHADEITRMSTSQKTGTDR